MKNLKISFALIALFAIGLTLTSCGNKPDNATKTEEVDNQSKEYASAYICPMHCKGSGSDEAGKCPVCGMDYVKNETYKGGDHNHDSHDGHNHDDHEGHDH